MSVDAERARLEGVYSEMQELRGGTMETETRTLPEAKPLADPEDEEAVLLYATDPRGVTQAMAEMLLWVERKIALMRVEVVECAEVARMAETAKWATKGTQRMLARAHNRLAFYQKIKAALEAGYLVVPNMPMRNLIVRRKSQRADGGTVNLRWSMPTFEQNPTPNLPQGEGENQNPLPSIHRFSVRGPDDPKTGQATYIQYAKPDELQDIEFPVEIAKPRVLAAVEAAAAQRLFDEIGIVEDTPRNRRAPGRGGDPILIARIRNPVSRRPDVSFFVAWAARLDRV
jgi:hypothetical protein